MSKLRCGQDRRYLRSGRLLEYQAFKLPPALVLDSATLKAHGSWASLKHYDGHHFRRSESSEEAKMHHGTGAFFAFRTCSSAAYTRRKLLCVQ